MSTIKKYSHKLLDDSIPVQALLYDDEQLIISQQGVALYDGQLKSQNHQSGSAHLTSHRLFYISTSTPSNNSLYFNLEQVTQSDYYAGFLKSSAKIILQFVPMIIAQESSNTTASWDSWECTICAYRNPPGLSPDASAVCGLCGVPRNAVPSSVPIVIPSTTRTSAVAARSLPTSPAPPSDSQEFSSNIPCSACTFLNHPSLRECEICGTPLIRSSFIPKHITSLSLSSTTSSKSKSAPSSRPSSPSYTAYNDDGNDEDENVDGAHPPTIKLSFRKGGDKAFYAAFKRVVSSKSWLANVSSSRYNNISNSSAEGNISRSGINGILKTLDTTHMYHTEDMTEAFRDLEALMRKAREMVGLARELNEKLVALETQTQSQSQSPKTESKTTQTQKFIIHNSLSQLGMALSEGPVVYNGADDGIGDSGEMIWMEELAKELAIVLLGSRITYTSSSYKKDNINNNNNKMKKNGLMDNRGIISLDEVWGGWNRARGVALLPPGILLQVVPVLEKFTKEVAVAREREGARVDVRIRARKLKSGLLVLHTSRFSLEKFVERIREYLGSCDGSGDDESTVIESMSSLGLNSNANTNTNINNIMKNNSNKEKFRTTTHIAHLESLSYALAEEMLIEAEMDGWVCRDDPRGFHSSSNSVSSSGRDAEGRDAGGMNMEIRWYVNEWVGYVWDGMVFE